MREIKFRAWVKEDSYTGREDGKKMFLNVQNTYDNTRGQISGDSFGGLIASENVILMQYTGIKDKNGKEIYEGDIIKCVTQYNHKFIDKVIFHEPDSAFMLDGDFSFNELKSVEVIGNIYENPELLNNQEEKNNGR